MIDTKRKYTARIDSAVEPGVKERLKEICSENNCYLSDIYRDAVYQGLYKYDKEKKFSEKKLIKTMKTDTINNDKATINFNVAIPREMMKC